MEAFNNPNMLMLVVPGVCEHHAAMQKSESLSSWHALHFGPAKIHPFARSTTPFPEGGGGTCLLAPEASSGGKPAFSGAGSVSLLAGRRAQLLLRICCWNSDDHTNLDFHIEAEYSMDFNSLLVPCFWRTTLSHTCRIFFAMLIDWD